MLVAYTVALDLIRALRPVVQELRSYSADAASQVERAATSIVHNIAEGERRYGRDPRRFFAMAHGSAGEVRGALDAAEAWGWAIHSEAAHALLDRELRLLYGLTRRCNDVKRQAAGPRLRKAPTTEAPGESPAYLACSQPPMPVARAEEADEEERHRGP